MADPWGLSSQIEQTFISVLSLAAPSFQSDSTTPQTTPIDYRAWYSQEQPRYPVVEVQAMTGGYMHAAAGGLFANPPGGTMIPTNAPPGFAQQVEQLTPHRGGVIHESEVECFIKTRNPVERSLLSSILRATLFGGVTSGFEGWQDGVPIIDLLSYYGINLQGWHADNFDRDAPGEMVEGSFLYTNSIRFVCSTQFIVQPVPLMGNRWSMTETLRVPDGVTPPWNF